MSEVCAEEYAQAVKAGQALNSELASEVIDRLASQAGVRSKATAADRAEHHCSERVPLAVAALASPKLSQR